MRMEETRGWRAANRAVWMIGTAAAAAYFVVLFQYGSGVRAETDSALQRQIAVEHEEACDALVSRGERARCLKLLIQLQSRHEQAYDARQRGLF